nr:Fur family transcriptional regulator [Micromonospora pisi]
MRSAGLTQTPRRRAILVLLAQCQRPMTAQAIHHAVVTAGERVGLTTIYRALHRLTEAGLLHAFDTDDGRGYRYCGGRPHQHLVCDRCGRVTECPPDVVALWLSQLREQTGFSPNAERLDLHGVCASCRSHRGA